MAGLFVSWSHSLAHDHTPGNALDHTFEHAAGGDTLAAAPGHQRSDVDFRVSSDDSHHEHSSRKALKIEACLACRSSSHDDADRAPAAQLNFELGIEGRLATARTESWKRVPRHAHPPRAPPA